MDDIKKLLFLGAESSNFAMNGPKNLSKSLYQKDRPFRAILDFAEKFQIFGILRLPNKFEDLKISSHFILLLNTSSKTICRKKIFGPISVEICCPEKMALKMIEPINCQVILKNLLFSPFQQIPHMVQHLQVVAAVSLQLLRMQPWQQLNGVIKAGKVNKVNIVKMKLKKWPNIRRLCMPKMRVKKRII